MKFSVITTTFNSAVCIGKNLESVFNQTFQDYEHIIIDNKSTDGTLEIIDERIDDKVRLYTDEDNGIYDAFNKGLSKAKGDYIIFLNSDDVFYDNETLEKINEFLTEKKNPIGIYGNLVYMKKGKVFRRWRNPKFLRKIRFGWMPAHPTLVLTRKCYTKNKFRSDFKISGDYEFMIRFFKENKKIYFFNKYLVKMSLGGVSNDKRFLLQKFIEDKKALRINGYKFSNLIIILKKLRKINQLLVR